MTVSATDNILILSQPEWTHQRNRHHQRLRPVVEPHLHRSSHKIRHPVIDFLFTYYPFSPAQLMRWTPGLGVALAGNPPDELLALPESIHDQRGWRLDPQRLTSKRLDAIRRDLDLLRAIDTRPPRFGCFGLHEWAMVYRTPDLRHPQLPLRLSPQQTARVVEELPLACSHYDAFRFFTPAARPLNRLQPAFDNRLHLEQSGCLHANMDLYKWAQRAHPWIHSDLIADTFELALAIREVDMRASPYDVTSLGLEPIPIETPEGRRLYTELQQTFTHRAHPLRQRLINALEILSPNPES
ncbi:MAG TPA: 3-methyladenine DNA glycosylase [Kiritimatiellia bacterium]|nr:3-methyladenine DNA glycosylase [Kiritimatiellia bacterium]